MKATLLVVTGDTTKRQVTLRLPCVLGRSREADVTVPHPMISRRHCRLSETNGLLMLRDLDSLNGTMIGGRRIASAPLPPDAEFTIGPLTFRVLYDYKGELKSLPQISYFDAAAEAAINLTAVAESHPTPDEAVPQAASRRSDSESGEVPDLAAWADADPEEVAMTLPVLRWPKPIADITADELMPAEPEKPQEDDPS